MYEQTFLKACPDQKGAFDYWIGGYGSGASLGEIWRIHINNGKCGEPICEADQESCTIKWGGQPDAINRLLLGYGEVLPQALVDAGLTEPQAQDLTVHIGRKSQAPLLREAMPVIDAIELAKFLVDMTKSFVRFSPGGNTVGGDSDVATVTKHEGFKWVSRKHYYGNKLNPLETDHV